MSYQETGAGDSSIVFAHGLLFNRAAFESQMEALGGSYRCLGFDFRGHGQSEVTQSGYDMDTLTEDTAALIQALGCGPCHFVGHSMGGFVGLRLALRHPELLASLILISSSADPEPVESIPKYNLLNRIVSVAGLRPVIGQVMPVMFGEAFRTEPARSEECKRWRKQLVANRRHITKAVRAVVDRKPVYDQLGKLTTPVLIIVAEHDKTTDMEKAARLRDAIPKAKLAIIPNSGHTPSVESPAEVNRAIKTFLGDHDPRSAAVTPRQPG